MSSYEKESGSNLPLEALDESARQVVSDWLMWHLSASDESLRTIKGELENAPPVLDGRGVEVAMKRLTRVSAAAARVATIEDLIKDLPQD